MTKMIEGPKLPPLSLAPRVPTALLFFYGGLIFSSEDKDSFKFLEKLYSLIREGKTSHIIQIKVFDYFQDFFNNSKQAIGIYPERLGKTPKHLGFVCIKT